MKPFLDGSVILRHDLFPLVCQTPGCNRVFSAEEAPQILSTFGLVYAELGNPPDVRELVQGLFCAHCQRVTALFLSPNEPVFDTGKLILSPNFSAHYAEELLLLKGRKAKEKTPPGLLVNSVSSIEILQDQAELILTPPYWVQAERFCDRPDSVPFLLKSRKDFYHRQEEEFQTKNIRLRRLYPDTNFFRMLVKCIHPDQYAIRRHKNGSFVVSALDSPEENLILAFEKSMELIEEAVGESFQQHLKDHFAKLGHEGISQEKFLAIADLVSRLSLAKDSERLFLMTQQIDYLPLLEGYFRGLFDEVFRVSLPIAAYSAARAILGDWLNELQTYPGAALLIDAPMGFGKTQAIIKELWENDNFSSVVFLPTKRMCEEFLSRYLIYEPLSFNKNRKPAEQDIYYVYGITPNDCDHFDEVVDSIKKKAGKKFGICTHKCGKQQTCRFWTQYEEAKHYRIIVTTHSQYDRFHSDKELKQWHNAALHEHENNIASARPRDAFIVDEDFILSKCYEPVVLNYAEFRAFVARFTEFLRDKAGAKTLLHKVIRFFGQIDLCCETSVIPRIDRRFRIQASLKADWKATFRSEYIYDPDLDDEFEDYGDYIDALEIGMRVGAVVEKHGKSKIEHQGSSFYAGGINRIHFPNPKTYDLSGAPPHVFIDGTLLEEKYIKRKIHGVDLRKLDYGKIKQLWPIRIWQNENTDLSIKNLEPEKEKVISFVKRIVNERGADHKYFILTSKSIKDTYLERELESLRQETGNLDYVIANYKSMRGLNEARECDICIMLGSCIVPDALEIAMALELVYLKLPDDRPVKTLNNLWTWKVGLGKREYKPDFTIVGELAQILRSSEHRQGLARTRYLDKEVDFYILSSDRVDEYEPFFKSHFIQKPRYQYASDIFKPRSDHTNSKYNQVKAAFFELSKKYGKGVIVTSIHRKTHIRRHTVKENLDRLVANGLARREGKMYFPVYPGTEKGEA